MSVALGLALGTRHERPQRQHDLVVVGGEPRVSLLPPELEARKRAAATRRLAVDRRVHRGGGRARSAAGAAWYYQLERNGRLEAARNETAALLQQQAKYADVKAAAAVVDSADDARKVVASTEIDWKEYFGEATQYLPPGMIDRSHPGRLVDLHGRSTRPRR